MLITLATAVIFTEIKAEFLKIFSDQARLFWNEWELRMMVLSSLGLQLFLVRFGNRWKRRPRIGLTVGVWSAYLLSDWVASVSLSTLFGRSGEFRFKSSKPKYAIMPFWGPFLLLHLGGPDTITAYSLDDNDLWLRRLIALALQGLVASYVCFLVTTCTTSLGLVAIPVLIAGIIKCGERTWILWSASGKQFRNSLFKGFPEPNPSDLESHGVKNSLNISHGGLDSQISEDVLQEAKYLHEAEKLFGLFKFLIANITFKFKSDAYCSFTIWGKEPVDAFKLIEVELGFMYDIIYTKASLIQSPWGPVLRSISLLCSISALVAFVVVVHMDPFSKIKHTIDVIITYILLVGAIVVDTHGALMHAFSNWTMLQLSKNQGNKNICSIYHHIGRWSAANCARNNGDRCNDRKIMIPQLNIICFFLGSMKANDHYKLYYDYYRYLGGYRSMTFATLDDKLKKRIHSHLECMGIRYGFKSFDFGYLRSLLDERGIHAVTSLTDSVHSELLKQTLEKEFDHSLLVWHIASHLCYHDDTDRVSSSRENSIALSDYMFYLVILHPTMIPNGISDLRIQHTRRVAVRYLQKDKIDETEACSKLLLFPDEHLVMQLDNRHKSVLAEAVSLAKVLKEIPKRWKLIRSVWVEMLTYAAAHCSWKQHAERLGEGGELLTHVRLLMTHLGLTEQIHRVDHIGGYEDEIIEDFQAPIPKGRGSSLVTISLSSLA